MIVCQDRLGTDIYINSKTQSRFPCVYDRLEGECADEVEDVTDDFEQYTLQLEQIDDEIAELEVRNSETVCFLFSHEARTFSKTCSGRPI